MKVSAAALAKENPDYEPWLQLFLLHANENGVTVESDHEESFAFLFLEDKTPEEALPEYVEFKRRWKAIHESNNF